MAEFPQTWAIYARAQAQLSRRNTSDDSTDGLEAGLNRFLQHIVEQPDAAAAELQMTRAIAAGARRSRYVWGLRARGDVPAPEEALDLDSIEARSDLVRLSKALGRENMMLLEAVGIGHDYPHLAATFGSNGAALRARVSRCRRVGRVVLAC
jgi:hypothetical protein